jgi:hypothetical protein
MSERVQDVGAAREGDEERVVPDLPSVGESRPKTQAEALRRAVADAVGAPPVDRPEAAGRVNALLATFVPMDANGRLLLELLGSNAFEGLTDANGVECRREAVRALLRIGFPWALEVEPETLAWFRKAESSGRRTRWVVALLLLAALVGGGAFLVVTRAVAPIEDAEPLPLPPDHGVKATGTPLPHFQTSTPPRPRAVPVTPSPQGYGY